MGISMFGKSVLSGAVGLSKSPIAKSSQSESRNDTSYLGVSVEESKFILFK